MRQLKITKQVTNRETASLDKYLQEIGKVDLITADEEVELAQRIKAGDQVALEKLTKANLRFVVSVAKQYQNQGEHRDSLGLFQSGVSGNPQGRPPTGQSLVDKFRDNPSAQGVINKLFTLQIR